VLPTAFDVDRPEDVDRLRTVGSELGRTAPETARALEGLSVETLDTRP
jgi:hypothetical protein